MSGLRVERKKNCDLTTHDACPRNWREPHPLSYDEHTCRKFHIIIRRRDHLSDSASRLFILSNIRWFKYSSGVLNTSHRLELLMLLLTVT